MINYDKFLYVYPPRPSYKSPADSLDIFDNGQYVAQPKYNGSCCVIFTNGEETHIYNRHKKPLATSETLNFSRLAIRPGKWFAYAGEYLNKGKLDESGTKARDKYIIWDCLVWESQYLVGYTTYDRLKILEDNFPCNRAVVREGNFELYDHLCCTQYEGIYKAPTYMSDFKALYRDIVKTDLYEGLVLKKLNSKLAYGFQPENNTDWQIKCRKETKLYNF